MDEQFDKKLTNHIRGVFDDYQHPGADHGWEQLRKKFPAEEKRNKVAWLWWSSAAAVVLVFLSIGIWYKQPVPVNNVAVKPTVNLKPQAKDTNNTQANPATVHTDEPVIAQNNTPVNHKPYVSPYSSSIGITPGIKNNTVVSIPVTIDMQQMPAIAKNPAIAQTKQPAVAALVIDSQRVINNITSQPQLANINQPATAGVVQPASGNQTNSMVKQPQQPAKTMAAMFENDRLNRMADTKTNKQDKQTGKKVNFSIYAATYFNYAEGSTNQVNAGAGFSSDIRLSKNFKLSTGVALAQNSLSYNGSIPSESARVMASAAPALKQEALFATTAVLPVFKNYNASLVGLDIPINIKYEFNPQKSDAYISAGLSSGTFIDESYTYRYTYSNGASSTSNEDDQQTAHNSFNSFYFGKTLNLSFGVGYPLGGNRIIIEPFVKYPLGGMGAQDIRFGAGGLNLKFSFKTQKK